MFAVILRLRNIITQASETNSWEIIKQKKTVHTLTLLLGGLEAQHVFHLISFFFIQCVVFIIILPVKLLQTVLTLCLMTKIMLLIMHVHFQPHFSPSFYWFEECAVITLMILNFVFLYILFSVHILISNKQYHFKDNYASKLRCCHCFAARNKWKQLTNTSKGWLNICHETKTWQLY